LLRLLAEWGNVGALVVAPLERALISKEPTSSRFISLTTITIRHSQNTLNLEWTSTAFTANNNNNNNNSNNNNNNNYYYYYYYYFRYTTRMKYKKYINKVCTHLK